MSGKDLVIAAVIAVALHCGIACVRIPAVVNLPEISGNKTLEMSLIPAYKENSDVAEVEVHEPQKEKPATIHRNQETVKKRTEKPVQKEAHDQAEENKKPDLPREVIPMETLLEGTEETDRPKEIASVEMPREETGKTEPPREIAPAPIPTVQPSLRAEDHEEKRTERIVTVPAMPRYKTNPPPKYPAIARRRGYEGRVILSAMISIDGTVVGVEVKESSGHLILDRAAMKAVETWEFEPATRMGSPISLSVDVPVRFVLRHP